MSDRLNVIDLQRFIKARSKGKAKVKTAPDVAPIVDMTERRTEILTEERRKVRRTILTEFIGAFVVVPQQGLFKVAISDISEGGIAFDVETGKGHFAVNEEVAMRVYLNQHTYFPFVIRVTNVRGIEEDNVIRHGANFVKGTINDLALSHFVKFIETVSASLETDAGDVTVTRITSG